MTKSSRPSKQDTDEIASAAGGIQFGERNSVKVGDISGMTGGEINIADGDVVKQTRRTINTGGGAYIQGDVTTGGGDFVGRDKIVTTNFNYGLDAELFKQFQRIQWQIDALPEDPDLDKAELKATIGKVEDEVKKGEQASARKVENWLRFIASMSQGIFQGTVSILANPVYSLPPAIQQAAQKTMQ